MGYRSVKVDRHVRRLLGLVERTAPPMHRLAVTAALEHYTATLAECLLEKPEARRLLGEAEVRSLLLWHALEESEHKAVAFDVFRAAGGPEWLRIWTMRTTSAIFVLEVVGHTALSLVRDPATYRPFVLFRSLAELRHSPFLQRDVLGRLRSFNRKGLPPRRLGRHRAGRGVARPAVRRGGELGGPPALTASSVRPALLPLPCSGAVVQTPLFQAASFRRRRRGCG